MRQCLSERNTFSVESFRVQAHTIGRMIAIWRRRSGARGSSIKTKELWSGHHGIHVATMNGRQGIELVSHAGSQHFEVAGLTSLEA